MKNQKPSSLLDAHIGERLRAARLSKGWTQAELGKKCDVTFQQIQKYETGNNRIAVSKLAYIASALDIPINYFFEGAPMNISNQNNVSNHHRVKEAADIIKCFSKITDPQQRRIILSLMKTMSSPKDQ